MESLEGVPADEEMIVEEEETATDGNKNGNPNTEMADLLTTGEPAALVSTEDTGGQTIPDEDDVSRHVGTSTRGLLTSEVAGVKPRHSALFSRLFRVSADEALLETFHCAHGYVGKLFVSQHFICFHSNSFQCPDVIIPFVEIRLIRKTSGLSSTGFNVYTASKKHSFTSFREGRDTVFDFVERVWRCIVPESVNVEQMAVSPASSDSTGEESADEEDDGMEVDVADETGVPFMDGMDTFRGSLIPPLGETERKETHMVEVEGANLAMFYKLILSASSTFQEVFHKMRDDVELTVGNWEETPEYGLARNLKYRTPVRAPIGPKSAVVEEVNRLFFSRTAGSMLECRTRTPGVPMGDSFQVELNYCANTHPGKRDVLVLRSFLGVTFLKSTWFKSKIQSTSMREGEASTKMWVNLAAQMLRDHISSKGVRQKPRKVRSKKDSAAIESQSAVSPPPKSPDELFERPPSLPEVVQGQRLIDKLFAHFADVGPMLSSIVGVMSSSTFWLAVLLMIVIRLFLVVREVNGRLADLETARLAEGVMGISRSGGVGLDSIPEMKQAVEALNELKTLLLERRVLNR